MNKNEFLNELRNALDGRLPEPDISEITSDYGDIFDNNTGNGKSEEETAAEIGSPARIARTILEDGAERKIFDKVIEPDQNVEIGKLAPMCLRLGAYIIDGVLLGVVAIGGFIALLAPFAFYVRSSSYVVNHAATYIGPMGNGAMHMGGIAPRFAFFNIIIIFLLLGAFNLFTTIILWATNGYTPGKWVLKMRVVKIDGSKISFLDAFLRELVVKCIANSLLSGLLNIGSFIWGCVTDDHKTVHDLLVHTRVIKWDRA